MIKVKVGWIDLKHTARMFIKPVEIGPALNASTTWTDLASNNHFNLQQQHQTSVGGGTVGFSPPLTTSIRSIFTAATNTILALPSAAISSVTGHANNHQSLSNNNSNNSSPKSLRNNVVAESGGTPDATPPTTPAVFRKNRTVMDFKYRILLKTGGCTGDGLTLPVIIYVIAVADGFKDIHVDWQFIEQHMFRRIIALEQRDGSLDDFLLREFEKMTENMEDSPGLPGKLDRIQDHNAIIKRLFKVDDVLLGFYKAGLWFDSDLIKGYVCLTKNHIFFHTQDLHSASAQRFNTALTFRDVSAVELVPAKRILTAECVQVTAKRRQFIFAISSHRTELYNALRHLSDVTMQRLARANNEIEPIKSLQADLGDQQSKPFIAPTSPTLLIGGGRLPPMPSASASAIDDSLNGPQLRRLSMATEVPLASPLTRNRRESSALTTVARSMEQLDDQKRNTFFQNLLHLPLTERVLEIHHCHFQSRQSTSTTSLDSHNCEGRIFISRNFLSFVSTGNPAVDSKSTPNPSGSNNGLLAASQAELGSIVNPTVKLVIPFAEITAVRKQNTIFNNFFHSGYLVILVRSKREFRFYGMENRDGLYDVIMEKIRSVEFPTELEIHRSQPAGHGDIAAEQLTVITRIEPLTIPLRHLFSTPGFEPGSRESLLEIPWVDFFATHGRDPCMIKDSRLLGLVISGIPEAFRSDLWMILSGACYDRPQRNYYVTLLEEAGRNSTPALASVTEEIEKDLHRSLPEHQAYQSATGIDSLRRVLTAYAMRNPSVGYAQSMNIITSVFLLYLREEDAFWLLVTLIERILPENYSKTLVGSVIDQTVFESLVEEYLGDVWRRMREIGVELSMFSVPWFVCLYINSLPFTVACRALDCFFYEGPTFLFKLGLAILRINEKHLVSSKGDDNVLPALRAYFRCLGTGDKEPTALDIRSVLRIPPSALKLTVDGSSKLKITGNMLCDHLFNAAFNDFTGVTMDKVENLRVQHRLKVVQRMEENSRKSQLRTLAETTHFSLRELGVIYDEFKRVQFFSGVDDPADLYADDDPLSALNAANAPSNIVPGGLITATMFRKMMREICPWKASISYIPIQPFTATLRGNSVRIKPLRLSLQTLFRCFPPTKPFPGASEGNRSFSVHDRMFRHAQVQVRLVNVNEEGQEGAGEAAHHEYLQRLPGADLPSIVQLLDLLCQPSNSNARIRFFFHLHDADGDGVWTMTDVCGVIESLLWLFIGKSLAGAEEQERVDIVARCVAYEITGGSLIVASPTPTIPLPTTSIADQFNSGGASSAVDVDVDNDGRAATDHRGDQWWQDVVTAVVEKEKSDGNRRNASKKPSASKHNPGISPISPTASATEDSVVRCITGLIEQFIRLHNSTTGGSTANRIREDAAGTAPLSPLSTSSSLILPSSGSSNTMILCHPRYREIVEITCKLPRDLRINIQDFLTTVLGEPILVEFFDKRGEL